MNEKIQQKYYITKWYNTKNTTIDPSGDSRSVPSYAPSVNPYRAPRGKQVEALQVERRTKLNQD